MIIIDELPFNFVEKECFKNFMRVTVPHFHIPPCRTVTRDCYELYLEKKTFEEGFQRSMSKSLSYGRYLDLYTKDQLHVFDIPLYR